MERHATLYRVARTLYLIPGITAMTRKMVRKAIQHLPLRLINQQRLYNFFALDTVPAGSVHCRIVTPNGRQLKLELDLRDDLSRRWYYLGYRGYEPEVTALLCRLLPGKRCVFDVGANIGFHTLLMGALLEGRGTVYAFEPLLEACALLVRNLVHNGMSAVRAELAALSNCDGAMSLFLPANQVYTNASLIAGFTHQDIQLPIMSQRFDTYCRSNGIERVDLIKIDVEGAEQRVLEGMGGLLNCWRPDIILEVLAPYAADLDAFFRGSAYRMFQIRMDALYEVQSITAHPLYRDYYLSCAPTLS
jgi:FkbM family methyltransferase